MADTYTEGVCHDGAAILRNGERMTITEILAALNAATPPADAALADALDFISWKHFKYGTFDQQQLELAAAVTKETGEVLQTLEDAAAYFKRVGMHNRQAQMEAAIDRLIVLDHAQPVHPRQLAEKQDAVRGNFRNNDSQSDGA